MAGECCFKKRGPALKTKTHSGGHCITWLYHAAIYLVTCSGVVSAFFLRWRCVSLVGDRWRVEQWPMGWATAADTCTHTLLRIEPRNLASNKKRWQQKKMKKRERESERRRGRGAGGGRWAGGEPARPSRVRTPQNVYTHHAGARDKCADGGPPIHPDWPANINRHHYHSLLIGHWFFNWPIHCIVNWFFMKPLHRELIVHWTIDDIRCIHDAQLFGTWTHFTHATSGKKMCKGDSILLSGAKFYEVNYPISGLHRKMKW